MRDVEPVQIFPEDPAFVVLRAIELLHDTGHENIQIVPFLESDGHWTVVVADAANIRVGNDVLEVIDPSQALTYSTRDTSVVGRHPISHETQEGEVAEWVLEATSADELEDPTYGAWFKAMLYQCLHYYVVPVAFDKRPGSQPTLRNRWFYVGIGAANSDVSGHYPGPYEPTSEHARGVLDPVAHSVAFELMLESVFLSELLQEAWFKHGQVLDVLHSPVDAYGYDLVLQAGSVIRHVQLKTKASTSATARYKLSTKLYDHPSACVIVLEWALNPQTSRIELSYRWFGNEPGEPIGSLGETIAKHSKGDSTGVKKSRPAHRVVPLGRFTKVSDVGGLYRRLFR